MLVISFLITFTSCGGSNTVSLHDFDELVNTGLIIGPKNSPEVNINKLKIGPRGWVFGSTEENGYMFILDPETRKFVQWNAGRTTVPKGRQYEGDITDFAVWEENDTLVILACQAYPAEIYRYDIPIPSSGQLPEIPTGTKRLVYRNDQAFRIKSIEKSTSRDGTPMILAGEYGNQAELLHSEDGRFTWTPIDYLARVQGLDGDKHKQALTSYAAVSVIAHIDGTWIISLYHAFLLSDESPWTSGYVHNINGILTSTDDGETWRIAQVQQNSRLPNELKQKAQKDRNANLLHPNFYGLVGEFAQTLTQSPDGRLIFGTAFDNVAEIGYGGRILLSDDGGKTWRESRWISEFTDIHPRALNNGIVLVGTTTQVNSLPHGWDASRGDVWLSKDNGETFTFLYRVIEAEGHSRIRKVPLYYTGVSAIVSTDREVLLGTVNESKHAELFILTRQ